MKTKLKYCLTVVSLVAAMNVCAQGDTVSYANVKYMQADNMLVFQRGNGGWPKAVGKVKVDYSNWLTKDQQEGLKKAGIKADDATIDNSATTKEIKALVKAYKETNNAAYLAAAEKGIGYLYTAQYKNGGWPQYYPDFSSYRSEITFNDNAVANVMNVLLDLKLGLNDFDVVNAELKGKADDALARGIDLILKTQLKYKDQYTGWCAQYDAKKLKPDTARAYELPSVACSETVGIVRFLMRLKSPSAEIKAAIKSAVAWMGSVKIEGFKWVEVADASAAKGMTRMLVQETGAVTWARFYDLDTNKPFFCDRDGVKKDSITEIGDERRNGYAWYGTWPDKILNKEYPKWLKENGE